MADPLQIEPQARRDTFRWPELIALAVIITYASHAIPLWLSILLDYFPDLSWRISESISPTWMRDLLALGFGLLLALSAPRRSGLVVGRIDRNFWKIGLVCAIPIVLTAIVYSFFTSKPFEGNDESSWIISPLAQELVFSGYLYGLFATRSRWRPVSWLPIDLPLVLSAVCFALWHLPNFLSMSGAYVGFQLCYVFVGAVWVGMTRVYTGSILYTTGVHMAVNYLAVHPLG